MENGIIKYIEELGDQRKELNELNAEILDGKSQYTVSMLATLMETLEKSISKLIIDNASNVYFDKDLGDTIKTTLSNAIAEFSKIKPPEVIFKPNINVDFKQLQSFISDVSKQNDNIIQLLSKPNQSEEVQKLMIALINKQNAFWEKNFEQKDITPQLKTISEGVNKKATEWVANVTKTSDDGHIRQLTINTTKY